MLANTESFSNHVLAITVCLLVFAFFKYGFGSKRKPRIVSIQPENIVYQYDYLLKLINNAAGASEVNYLAEQIERFLGNYSDHPDVQEYADSLRDELQIQANYLMVMDSL